MERSRMPLMKLGGKPVQLRLPKGPYNLREVCKPEVQARLAREAQEEEASGKSQQLQLARQQQPRKVQLSEEEPFYVSHRMYSFLGQLVYGTHANCPVALAESEHLPLVGELFEPITFNFPLGANGSSLLETYGKWTKMTLNGWPHDGLGSPCPCVQLFSAMENSYTFPVQDMEDQYFALVDEGNGCYVYYLRTDDRPPPQRGSTAAEWIKAGPIVNPYKIKMITLGCHDNGNLFLVGIVDDDVVTNPRLVVLNSSLFDPTRWNFSEPWTSVNWNGLNRLDYIHVAERLPSFSQASTRADALTDLIVTMTDINGKVGCLCYVRELNPGGSSGPTSIPGWHCNTVAFEEVEVDIPGNLETLTLRRAQSHISSLDPSLGYHIFMAFVDDPEGDYHNRIVYNWIGDEEPVYPTFHPNWKMTPVTSFGPCQLGAISNSRDELYYPEDWEAIPMLSTTYSDSWPPNFGSGSWVMTLFEFISGAQVPVLVKMDPSVRFGIDTCKFPSIYRSIFVVSTFLDDPAELVKIVYNNGIRTEGGCSWWQDHNPDDGPLSTFIHEGGGDDVRAKRRQRRMAALFKAMMRRLNIDGGAPAPGRSSSRLLK